MNKEFNLGDFVLDTDKNEYGIIVPNIDDLNSFKLYRKVCKSNTTFYKACNIGKVKIVNITSNKLFGTYEKLYQRYMCHEYIICYNELETNRKDVLDLYKSLTNNIMESHHVKVNNYNLEVYNKCLKTKNKLNCLDDLKPGNVYLVAIGANDSIDLKVLVYCGQAKLASNNLFYKVDNKIVEEFSKKVIRRGSFDEITASQKPFDDYLKTQSTYLGYIYNNLFAQIGFSHYCRYNYTLNNILSNENAEVNLQYMMLSDSYFSNMELFELGNINFPKNGELAANRLFIDEIDGYKYIFNYIDNSFSKSKKVHYQIFN